MLNILREISQSKLSKLCRISQPIISNIVNVNDFKLSKQKCEDFGSWFIKYQQSRSNTNKQASLNITDIPCKDGDQSSEGRLTFHTKLEVPQLKEWFQQNRNPSERILAYYADILNQSHLRLERNKVTVKSLKNWWKNYKQKQRNLNKLKSKTKTT